MQLARRNELHDRGRGHRRQRPRTIAAGLVLVAGCAAFMTAAYATPGSGVSEHVLSQATLSKGWTLSAKGPATVVFDRLTLAPGGRFGWHSHGASLLVSTVRGVGDSYTKSGHACKRTVLGAGRSFTEHAGVIHDVFNTGKTDLVLITALIIPKGHAIQIDKPRPAGCPK